MAGAVEGDTFIGRKATDLRGLLRLKYPIEHGIVTDWDDMERIWQHLYIDELKTLSEEVTCTCRAFAYVADNLPQIMHSIQSY